MGRRKRRRSYRPYGHSSRQVGNCPLGRIDVARSGYGFVETEEGTFYIPANRMGGAMHGDTVEVRPKQAHAEQGKRREAVVVRVHRRAIEFVAGRLEINDPLAVVIPEDPRIQHDIFVTLAECPDAKDGDMVLARITSYPSRRDAACGYIVETLGAADQPGMDTDIIIHNAGLPNGFSPQALAQADATEADIEGALAEPRRSDLRQRTIFTVDPADAKDFDDAISIDRVEGMIRLGVHIADVSSYVAWDDHIDICARDRATSTYLADRVLPMLPEKLSNDICSLRPGAERRAFTCDMFLDDAGVIRKYQLHTSVIRSSRRFSYEEADRILEGQPDPLSAKLLLLHETAEKLLARREARGALDFDGAEAKPVLDEDGHVIDIALRVKTPATSMIEEAMIAANETVAGHLFRKKLPCAYRVHAAPQAKALEALVPLLAELGIPTAELAGGTPAAYQNVLTAVQDRPCADLVNSLMLRSMERARYSTQPQGHFGLAATHYCHFTSPIRRYPDLMVHRLLKDGAAMEGQLDWLCEHSSKMERIAEEAERTSVMGKICEYLEPQVGKTFVGTISGVLAYGFFVRLDITAEGFVRFDEARDEYHEFDPKMQTLVGEETGRTFRIGQQVRVRLVGVSRRDQQIDFELA